MGPEVTNQEIFTGKFTRRENPHGNQESEGIEEGQKAGSHQAAPHRPEVTRRGIFSPGDERSRPSAPKPLASGGTANFPAI
jgi:hypothetical protein